MLRKEIQLDKIDENFKITKFAQPTEDIYDEKNNQKLLKEFLSLEEKIVRDED